MIFSRGVLGSQPPNTMQLGAHPPLASVGEVVAGSALLFISSLPIRSLKFFMELSTMAACCMRACASSSMLWLNSDATWLTLWSKPVMASLMSWFSSLISVLIADQKSGVLLSGGGAGICICAVRCCASLAICIWWSVKSFSSRSQSISAAFWSPSECLRWSCVVFSMRFLTMELQLDAAVTLAD